MLQKKKKRWEREVNNFIPEQTSDFSENYLIWNIDLEKKKPLKEYRSFYYFKVLRQTKNHTAKILGINSTTVIRHANSFRKKLNYV